MVLLCRMIRLKEWTEISATSWRQIPADGGVVQVFSRRVDFLRKPKKPVVRAHQKHRSSGAVNVRRVRTRRSISTVIGIFWTGGTPFCLAKALLSIESSQLSSRGLGSPALR